MLREAVVGRDRQGRRVAAAHELGVDEGVADVDVGEQALVDVAALGVEHEPHRLALDQLLVEVARLGAEALDRLARLDALGRVDADVAEVLFSSVEIDLDRVAVDDAGDLGSDGAGLGRFRLIVVPAADEQVEDDRQ